jgi:hypothetical protein
MSYVVLHIPYSIQYSAIFYVFTIKTQPLAHNLVTYFVSNIKHDIAYDIVHKIHSLLTRDETKNMGLFGKVRKYKHIPNTI